MRTSVSMVDVFGGGRTPCEKLVLATIDRGLRDALGECVKKHEKREAKIWLSSSSLMPWSFLWCVQHCGWTMRQATAIRVFVRIVGTMTFQYGPDYDLIHNIVSNHLEAA